MFGSDVPLLLSHEPTERIGQAVDDIKNQPKGGPRLVSVAEGSVLGWVRGAGTERGSYRAEPIGQSAVGRWAPAPFQPGTCGELGLSAESPSGLTARKRCLLWLEVLGGGRGSEQPLPVRFRRRRRGKGRRTPG